MYEITNQLYLGVIFMTAAVLSAAGVLCGKKTKCRKMVKKYIAK